MSEAFCSAGGIDTWFNQRWPSDKWFMIKELTCRHIPHGGMLGDGWNGSPGGSPRWRQIGMLTAGGIFAVNGTTDADLRDGRFRFVDTLRADVWEGEIADGKLPTGLIETCPDGLFFQGKDVGRNHIHVAKWG
jgi:hypothetical protein